MLPNMIIVIQSYIDFMCTDSLYNVIRDGGCLQWLCDTHDWETMLSPNVRRVLRMSLNGLEYLHEQNIKHGDLKCKYHVFAFVLIF